MACGSVSNITGLWKQMTNESLSHLVDELEADLKLLARTTTSNKLILKYANRYIKVLSIGAMIGHNFKCEQNGQGLQRIPNPTSNPD
jgi:hypothetical protein